MKTIFVYYNSIFYKKREIYYINNIDDFSIVGKYLKIKDSNNNIYYINDGDVSGIKIEEYME